MAKIGAKHDLQNITYSLLLGGINVATHPDMIDDRELQECNNMWYDRDTNKLRTRGGVSSPLISFNANVIKLWEDWENGTIFIFLENKEVYKTENLATAEYIGTYNGEKTPCCVKHVGKVFIASGNILQYYDYENNIQEVADENAPISDIIFSKYGRLASTYEGSNYLDWSGVSDGTYWTLDTNDPSAGAKTEIGQDGGTITTMVDLSTDMMIFKNSGIIYQYTGYPPENEQVQKIAIRPATLGRNSVLSLSTEVIYLNDSGLQQLTTTMDYGNITSGDAPMAVKFNRIIKDDLYEPKLWHLSRNKCVVIQSNSDTGYQFVLYNYVVGGATTWVLHKKVVDMIEYGDDLLFAIGNNIQRCSYDFWTDEEETITWKMKFKRLTSMYHVFLRWADIMLDSDHSGTAILNLTKTSRTVPLNQQKKFPLNNTNKYIEPILTGTAPITFHHLTLMVSEV